MECIVLYDNQINKRIIFILAFRWLLARSFDLFDCNLSRNIAQQQQQQKMRGKKSRQKILQYDKMSEMRQQNSKRHF